MYSRVCRSSRECQQMRRHKKFDAHTRSRANNCCFMKDTIFIRSNNHSVCSSSNGCCSGVLPSLSVSSQQNFVRKVPCLRRESLSAEFGVRHWMKRNLYCMKETNVEYHGGYIFSNEEILGNLNVLLAIGTKPSMWTFYLQLMHKWNVH